MNKKKLISLVFTLGLVCCLLFFSLKDRKPYEVLHSTVMTSANLTEYKITLVLHTLLPPDEEALAKEFVEHHMRLNGDLPNPYYQLELYRSARHYQEGRLYDRILVNEYGEIVTEIDESVFE